MVAGVLPAFAQSTTVPTNGPLPQFGVKPLAPGVVQRASAEVAVSRGNWLYAAAAAFALLTVGLVVYRRRAARGQPAARSSGA